MIKIEFTSSEEFVVFVSVIRGEDTERLKVLTQVLNESARKLKQAEEQSEGS